MQRGVKTPELRGKYKKDHCVWNWSTKNPSRPTSPAQNQQHQHNSTSTDHSHTTVSNHSQHSQSSPSSWAEHQGWIHSIKSKPIAKASKHGYLSKIRSSKEQTKHQGGAGQARRGAKHKEVQGKPPGRSRASTRGNWSSSSKSITNITISHS
jgi:hypothetical protein